MGRPGESQQLTTGDGQLQYSVHGKVGWESAVAASARVGGLVPLADGTLLGCSPSPLPSLWSLSGTTVRQATTNRTRPTSAKATKETSLLCPFPSELVVFLTFLATSLSDVVWILTLPWRTRYLSYDKSLPPFFNSFSHSRR